jgi:hypothetical protein
VFRQEAHASRLHSRVTSILGLIGTRSLLHMVDEELLPPDPDDDDLLVLGEESIELALDLVALHVLDPAEVHRSHLDGRS